MHRDIKMRYSPFVSQIVSTSFDRSELTTFVMSRRMEISTSEHKNRQIYSKTTSEFRVLSALMGTSGSLRYLRLSKEPRQVFKLCFPVPRAEAQDKMSKVSTDPWFCRNIDCRLLFLQLCWEEELQRRHQSSHKLNPRFDWLTRQQSPLSEDLSLPIIASEDCCFL